MATLELTQRELKVVKDCVKMVYQDPEIDERNEAKVLLSLLSKLQIKPSSIGIDNIQDFLADLE